MSMVDNRVVKMTFDNAQFERNIKNTMQTLSQFEQSLKLDGATAGFEKLKEAADKLSLSALGDKASEEAQRIDKMSSDASNSIDKIDDAASKADFSALSDAATEAVAGVNNAADSADMSGLSDAAVDTAGDVNSAINSIDMSQISDKANEASSSFSALETVAVGVLLNIGGAIEQQVMSKLTGLKNALVGPVADGFKEYETQIGAIQTIIANTGMDFDSDADIQKVNDTLDELNNYADETIYNFTEMTKAIGTFTSSGMGLEQAKNAVQGAANVAALAGAGGTELTRVLPQLAQALSAGAVSQQDWMSIQTAHMDSRLFVEAIGDMAVHMAQADKAGEEAFIAGQRLLEGENMRSLLNKKDNKDIADWFSSDILEETLQVFTYDLHNMEANERAAVIEHLRELGYTTDEEIEGIAHLAEMAKRAATEVRTWSQLKDTLGEGIGSAWSGIWRNFIGDFKQATDNFTFLSNTLGNGVNNLLGGLVHSFQIFNRFEDTEGFLGEQGAVYRVIEDFWGKYKRYEVGDIVGGEVLQEGDGLIGQKVVDETTHEAIRIKGAFDYLVEAITKPLGAIKDAFDNVFGMSDIEIFQTVSSLVLAFKDFAQTLVISDNAATGLRHIFEGLFSILHVAITIVMDLGAAFFGLIGVLRIFIDPIIDIALAIGGQLGKVVVWIHDRFMDLRAALIYTIYPILDMVGAFGELVASAFGFVDIPGKIEDVGDIIIWILDLLWDIIDLPGKIGLVGDAIRGMFSFIGDIFGWNAAVKESEEVFANTGIQVSALDIWIGKLLKNPIISFFASVAKEIGHTITVLKNTMNYVKDPNNSTEPINVLYAIFGKLVDVVGTIAQAFGSMLSVVLQAATIIGGGIVGAIYLLVTGLINLGNWLYKVGSTAAVTLQPVADALLRLGSAIGDFIVKLWNFFLAWEPIRGLLSIIQDVKNGIVGFFTDIYNKITNVGGKIYDAISGTTDNIKKGATKPANLIEEIIVKIESLTSIIRNLTPEKALAGIKFFFSNIKDKVTNFFDYVSNLDFRELANEWTNSLAKLKMETYKKFNDILNYLSTKFPSSVQTIRSFIAKIANFIADSLTKIQEIIQNAKYNSKDLPSFIANLLVEIIKAIANGLKNLITFVATNVQTIGSTILNGLKRAFSLVGKTIYALLFDRSKFGLIIYSWKKFGSDISETVRGALEKISPALADTYDKIIEFFTGTEEAPSGFVTFFTTLWNGLKDTFKNAPSTIGKYLSNIKKWFVDTFDGITYKLSTAQGVIGEFFSMIREKLGLAKENAETDVSSIGASMGALPSAVGGPLEKVTNKVRNLFKLDQEDDQKKSFLERLKEFFASKFNFFIEKAKSLPKQFGSLLDAILEVFSEERVTKVTNLLMIVSRVKLVKSLSSFFKGLGSLSRAVARRLSPKDAKTVEQRVRDWAISLAIVAASLYVISKIKDPWTAVGVLVAIGAVLLVMQGVSAALIKFTDGVQAGQDLLMAAASIAVLAAGVFIMMKAVEALNGFNYKANEKGLIAMGVLLLVMLGFATIISAFGGRGGENMIQIAAGMILMVVALTAMLIPIKMLADFFSKNNMSDDEFLRVREALVAICIFVIGIGAAMALAGKHAISASIGFVLMSIALSVLGDTIAKLTALGVVNYKALVTSMVGLLALVAAFGIMAKFVKTGELIGAAAALVIFSAAVVVMSYGISQLAKQKWESIEQAGIALVALYSVLGILTAALNAKDLALTGAAMLVFSASCVVMAYAIGKIAAIDANALVTASSALNSIVFIFGLLATVLSIPVIAQGAQVVLPLLSLAFISLGAAALLVGIALEHAAHGILMLAQGAPILNLFVQIVAQNAAQFGLAALALGALGAALLLFGPGAVIAGVGLTLLSNGIRDFLILVAQLPELLANAGAAVSYMLGQLPIILGNVRDTITTWFSETLIPALQAGFEFVVTNLGTFAETVRTWFMEKVWPLIVEYGGKIWDWFQTEGLPKLKEIVSQIGTKLIELKDKFVSWMQTDGLPALSKAAGDIWQWFTTDGVAKIGEIIGKVLECMGTLAEKFKSWILSDGIPMMQQAVSDLSDKFFELGGKLANWVRDELPGVISSAASFIWGKLQEIGGYIAEGIASGITNGVEWITNAVSGLGSSALESIKSFFGISSPSKLMRDEVGRYIPAGVAEGITKFSTGVVSASENLGTQALDGINSVLGKADYDISSPSITPVMNMSGFASDAKSYNQMLKDSMVDNTLMSNNRFTGEMSLSADLASKLDTDMNKMDALASTLADIRADVNANAIKTEELYLKTSELLQSMNTDTSAIRSSIASGLGLQLDTGQLIGILAPGMDAAFGRRMAMASRGVY